MSLARKTFDDFDNMDMNMGLGFGNVGMGNMGHMGQMGMGGLGGMGMGMGTPSQTRSRMFDLLGGMRNDMVDQVYLIPSCQYYMVDVCPSRICFSDIVSLLVSVCVLHNYAFNGCRRDYRQSLLPLRPPWHKRQRAD